MIGASKIVAHALLVLFGYLFDGGITPVEAMIPDCTMGTSYLEDECYLPEEALEDESEERGPIDHCIYYEDYLELDCQEDVFEIEREMDPYQTYGKERY